MYRFKNERGACQGLRSFVADQGLTTGENHHKLNVEIRTDQEKHVNITISGIYWH